MSASRIAVLSDVHGNLTAFAAVLDHAERNGIDTVVNLGDVVGKGPRGSACIALARARCSTVVRGNWDEWLGADQPRMPGSLPPRDRDAVLWWHDELSAEDRAWLRALPLAAALDVGGTAIRFVHASTAGVWQRVWLQHDADRAASFFGPVTGSASTPTPTVVCYGDIHTPFVESLPQGLLVNVGSVGNALDHPSAVYAVLEAEGDRVTVRFERVGYDVDAELAVAADAGMPLLAEWTGELREARYRGSAG